MNKYQIIPKFIKLIFNLICFLLAAVIIQTSLVYGQTPTKKATTPSPSPTLDVVEKLKKIEILKEKIATKVTELRENEKGALAGAVKKIDSSQIIITTRTGQRTFSFSEDTIFYLLSRDSKTETNLKKLKEGQNIAVFGYFDEKRENLSAKYVYLTTPGARLMGKITDIDKTNYTISVKEPKGTTTVDIETSTKTFILGKDNNLIKSGFSKFKVGDIVHIQGIINPKREDTITANRVIIVSPSTVVTPSVTPTPLVKTTSKPTVEE